MYVEGKGFTAPSPHVTSYSRGAMYVFLEEAQRRAKHRGYSMSDVLWNKGLIDEQNIPSVAGTVAPAISAILIGMIGEYAVADFATRRFRQLQNCAVDFSLTKRGDYGWDLVLFNTRISIKARKSHPGVNLIRSRTPYGKRVGITADVVCFSEVNLENYTTSFLGWMRSRLIRKKTEVPARKGDHFNQEVTDIELDSPCRLVDYIISRRKCMEVRDSGTDQVSRFKR